MTQRNKNTGRKKTLTRDETQVMIGEALNLALNTLIGRLDKMSDTDRIAFFAVLRRYGNPSLKPVTFKEEDDDLAEILNFN